MEKRDKSYVATFEKQRVKVRHFFNCHTYIHEGSKYNSLNNIIVCHSKTTIAKAMKLGALTVHRQALV